MENVLRFGRPLTWLRNTVRNGLKASALGRLLQNMGGGRPNGQLHIVSATRMNETEFWKASALGRSLKIWRSPSLQVHIQFENATGLSAVYNAQLETAKPGDVLVFVHDDVWLDDPQWIAKIHVALKRFDVVGVAGCTRRLKNQPAWHLSEVFKDGQPGWEFVAGNDRLSGAMGHGKNPKGSINVYGAWPASCELLDGVFLAVRADVTLRSKVLFDERFDFDFYDLDFCRSARQAGLSLGTWPIALTHQSEGQPSMYRWEANQARYLAKWRS